MKLNIKLLRKVQKRILQAPERFNMSTWVLEAPNKCGTVCCIAGHAMLEDGYRWDKKAGYFTKPHKRPVFLMPGPSGIHTRAAKALGLTMTESESVFGTSGWPKTLFDAFYDPTGTKTTQAYIAAARIEHLINHHA